MTTTLSRLPRIDAHIHLAGDAPDTLSLLDRLGVRVLNICVAIGEWRTAERATYRTLARSHPGRYAWCTTFDLPAFADERSAAGGPPADYAERVIHDIARDVDDGAVGVKVWKNVGMELARPDGSRVLVDDPVFEPVFAFLAAEGIPTVMHIGEPLACWQPIETESPHRGYYEQHPEWHMHGRTDIPSHAELVASRDRVLDRHPTLRVIGAHIGSLEHDVREAARRLERYPNFAVDISARLDDLQAQDPRTVRDFLTTYQDRVLFGTDVVARRPTASLPATERESFHAALAETYSRYASYLETEASRTADGRAVAGLTLPEPVLRKLYTDNARAWYPALRV